MPRLVPLILYLLLGGAARAEFRFIHSSDSHFNTETQAGSHAAEDVARFREIGELTPRPVFVVNTGDVTDLGTDAEYLVYRDCLKHLVCPIYCAPGNHDVRWNPLGKEGYVKGVGQPLYQSWDHEGVHFVTLDSTVLLQHWGHFDQDELNWLRADLAKLPRDMPIIIGFHHWIGRESVMVDNEQQLLEIVAPYNLRLWLQGHGHSDIQWNVNGTPAIMEAGLYQGSFTVIDVGKDSMTLRRRHWGKADTKQELMQEKGATRKASVALPVVWDELMIIPLARPVAPKWNAQVAVDGEQANIAIDRGDLPAQARFAYRFDQSKYEAINASEAPATRPSIAELAAGIHAVTVQAELPDGRAYQMPLQTKLTRAGTPQPAWVAQLSGAVLSHLVRDGESLYVSSMSGDVCALEAADGTIKWTFHTGGSVFSTPHIDNGVIYFGSADHNVYAVDVSTGKEKWRHQTDAGIFGGPAVGGGVVAIASTDRHIYGLNAATGERRWTVGVGGMYQSKAATDGKHFFLGGWDNCLRAIDAGSGQEIWVSRLGRNKKSGNIQFAYSPAIASPAVGDGKVYVTSNDGVLHAVNIADGTIAWEFDNKRLGYSSPLFHDNKVFVAIGDPSKVFCLDAGTGKLLWAVGPRIEKDPEDKEGQKTIKTLEGIAGADIALPVIYDSSAAFAAGHIYIGSVDGTFNCIDAGSGQLVWQYALGPGHVLASPAADAGRVYISSMSGKVTALPLAPQEVTSGK